MSSYNFPCPPDYEMKVTEDALALAVSGDTAPSGGLTAGKYIFLTGHSTLPDGGYHVKDTDIGAGETLSASNIEADGEGFANALNAKVSELNTNLAKITKVIELDLNNFVIGANGYTGITNPSTPSGYTLLFAEVHSATYSSPGEFPRIEGRGGYVYGTASKTYTQITVRFIYVMI